MNEQTTVGKSRKQKAADMIVRVICLLISFCMWIYVMMVESPEHEQIFSHLTVEVTGTDALTENDLVIYSGYGTMIDVTLSGKKSVVSKLEDKDIVVTADVGSITASGRYNCKVNVDVPPGCKLAGMSQNEISVYVDKGVSVNVDLVEQRDNTNLPEGCFTGTVEFPVDKINVTGPDTVLQRVEKAKVVLDLSGVTRTTTFTAPVVLINAVGDTVNSPYIDYYPTEVTVTVPVYKTVTVPVRTTFKNGFLTEDTCTVDLNPATVQATGDPDVIDRGNLFETIVIDEKTEFENNALQKTVTLVPAEGVTLSASQVEVTAEIDPSIKVRDILIPGSSIEDTGAKEGVNYTWDREEMVVTLMGPVESLSKIDAEDITLVFDMSPYSETNTGTIRVRAEVVVDSIYKDDVLAIGTYDISVTFTN